MLITNEPIKTRVSRAHVYKGIIVNSPTSTISIMYI
jgi:hypothetical protein